MAKKTSYYKITAGFPGYVYGWEIKLSMSVATISFSLVSFSATSLDLGVLPDFCSWNLTSGSKDLANVEPKEHWYFLPLMISPWSISVARVQHRAKSWEAGGLFVLESSVHQVVKPVWEFQETEPRINPVNGQPLPGAQQHAPLCSLTLDQKARQGATPTLWPGLTLRVRVLIYISEKMWVLGFRRRPVHPKGDQSWVFIGRTDAEAETPVLWPPDVKSWLIWKDPDAGRDWGQEEKGTTEDDMAGWHHWLNGHEFGWTLGVGDGQGGLACCGSWGHKESDMTERLNWTELRAYSSISKAKLSVNAQIWLDLHVCKKFPHLYQDKVLLRVLECLAKKLQTNEPNGKL